MSQYQVIARKYRPQKLSQVVGQEAVVTTLKNALQFDRIAHAYLFCGCRGTGKTTLARVFAKALNCQNRDPDFEPCNNCTSCIEITESRSLDVLEIDGASNRGIDDIRQINETVGYTPSLGPYKIYIIDEVHMLTKEAFNALLKTLEEPPPHVKFFFATTEPHKILPTIISRCQRFDLSRISLDAIARKLRFIAEDLNVSCEEEIFPLIANLAEGSLRDAESLLDQVICYTEPPLTLAKVAQTLGLTPKAAFFALDKAFEEQNLSYAFELAAHIFSSGKDFSHFLDLGIEHYRTHLKLKINPHLSFPTQELKKSYLSSNPFYSEEQCLSILDFLIKSSQESSKTPFKRVHLEAILLHIIRSKYHLSLPFLVKRLQELEKSIKEPPTPTPEKAVQKSPPSPPSPKKEERPSPEPVKVVEESPKKEEPTLQQEKPVAPAPVKLERQSPSPLPTPKPAKVVEKGLKKETPSITQVLQKKIEQKPVTASCHYDTLIRFASVELEGVVKSSIKKG